MSILDTAELVKDFQFCHVLEIKQTTASVYLVQANYNNRILETTGDLEYAVDFAHSHDKALGAAN